MQEALSYWNRSEQLDKMTSLLFGSTANENKFSKVEIRLKVCSCQNQYLLCIIRLSCCTSGHAHFHRKYFKADTDETCRPESLKMNGSLPH